MNRLPDPQPPNGAPPPALSIRDLSFSYPDGRPALQSINLSIAPGESVALVGPNGAGKSTLLLHLNGLLPGRSRSQTLHSHGAPTSNPSSSGSVWVDGLEVNHRNGPEIRRRVGLLFQDPDDQLFSTSVLEDVAFGPLNLGLKKSEARQIALDCLARVDLLDSAGRMPHHLSFGERKRVCLAGVLACSPSILVMDEPSANLDPRARRRFMALIESLPSTRLIATHDLEMVLDLCSRTILLDSGRVIATAPSRDLLGDPDLMDRHGLEVPMSLRTGSRV